MNGSSNNNYTLADIERYHQGKMSPEEMNVLEKAALDDPFLADALEGFQITDNATSELNTIKSSIDRKIRKRKQRAPITRIYLFTRVAALILLIIGGGWFIYKLLIPGNNSLSEIKHDIPKVDSLKDQRTTNNRIQGDDSLSYTVSTAGEQKRTSNGYLEKDQSHPTKNNYKGSKSGFVRNKIKSDSGELTAFNRNNGSPNSVIEKSEPAKSIVALPQILRAGKKDSGNYTAAAVSTKEKGTTTDTINGLNVSLKPVNTNLSEVVVSNKMAKKKPTASASAAESYKNAQEVKLDTLEPAQGWNNYNDYLANNLKTPEVLQIKPVSGEVELSFDISNEGEPINIKVEKSLCGKCDEEAIRLLKAGPKWKKKKNKKGKISIHF
jgi:hypothetical protein